MKVAAAGHRLPRALVGLIEAAEAKRAGQLINWRQTRLTGGGLGWAGQLLLKSVCLCPAPEARNYRTMFAWTRAEPGSMGRAGCVMKASQRAGGRRRAAASESG